VIIDFAQCVKKRPDIRLLLIGGGEQEKTLRNLVIQLGISARVSFTGLIAYEEIPEYLSLVTVGINPMEIREVSDLALPNKVLQYLCLGLPVVSTKLRGLKATFAVEGLINWVSSPAGVITTALTIKPRTHQDPLALALERAESLRRFEPITSVDSIERSFIDLAET
jgi:glycosyltransferase involved in cell wall biosynthesis